ncbi:MAG: redoxin domain-containing protein [Chloroflexi bacterium]|nr:redoxin domain-containing protein [Chloroflexota bacterium]
MERYNSFVQINKPVPDFSLPDLDGNLHQLGDYRGRIVIVNFWSCECPHSERADRAIMAMSAQWREDVVVLSIAARIEASQIKVWQRPLKRAACPSS